MLINNIIESDDNEIQCSENICVLYPILQPFMSILKTVNSGLTRGEVQADRE
jgi:hypothetical protein